MPSHTPQGRFRVVVRLFDVGDQSVEIDIGVNFLVVLAVKIVCIDFIHFDDQRRHVLDVQIDPDRIVNGEILSVSHREIDIDALFQLLKLFRWQPRRPLLCIPKAMHDLRLGKRLLEVGIVNVRGVRLVSHFGQKEMLQIAAHKRFIISDRRQERHATIVGIQISRVTSHRRLFDVLAVHVAGQPWQLDVGHKTGLVVDSPFLIQLQAMMQQVDF